MARSRQQMSVQLFPFLAVLVCVMGSLILLLLVTARRMRVVAVAKARAAMMLSADDHRPLLPEFAEDDAPQLLPTDDVASPAPSWSVRDRSEARRLTEQLERDWRQRVESLRDSRDVRTQAIIRQKLLASGVQKRIDELKSELQQLQTEYGQLTGQMSAANLQPATGLRERVQLEEQIAQLRQRLKQLEDLRQNNNGKFAVVPFDGKSGTTRRPILIECTATGIRFVAEDVTLKPSDIAGFSEAYNPLLAGSSALVNYWKQWNLDHPQDDAAADPYVLLLVRPSGTVAYYIAMRMLSPMKQPHGYELIAEDLPIAVPPSEPGAKAACEAAIQRTLAERQQIVNAVRGGPVDSILNTVRQPMGKPRPPAGKSEFNLDDVGPESNLVGSRSWESPERFGGQEHRRRREPDVILSPGEPPQTLSHESTKQAAPVPSPPPAGNRRVAEPSPGPQLSPDIDDQQPYPSFAQARKRSGQSRDLPYEHLQRRRWGPHDPGASIGVEKPVVIRVDAQHLIVADEVIINVPLGASRTDVFDRLLTVIDRQAQTWGKPGSGFFWVPSLKFVISPGGNQTYERIVPLVTKCGLSSSAEFTLDQVQPVQGGCPS
jgi:hypothetical protein